jgi:glutamate N-acetyltransferase/amino-acid N-acetyltransferase
MPMEKIERGIADAGQYLGNSLEHALTFADAILTTDTKRKAAAVEVRIGKQVVTVAGVCKGSGMIGPRMALPDAAKGTAGSKPATESTGGRGGASYRARRGAHATMLAYLTTDAAVPPPLLRQVLARASDATFNAVTIDDHTSTNDTAVLLASGASGARLGTGAATDKFAAAVMEVCQSLAYQIAADGEGATKVVVVTVKGAASESDARAMARAIANSPLVKCAMHGNDPNWGRIVSAAGLAGVPFDPDRATLTLQGTVVFRNGQPVPFNAEEVSGSLNAAEVRAELSCRLGKGEATCWTCDLSKDYVTINADYHT